MRRQTPPLSIAQGIRKLNFTLGARSLGDGWGWVGGTPVLGFRRPAFAFGPAGVCKLTGPAAPVGSFQNQIRLNTPAHWRENAAG